MSIRAVFLLLLYLAILGQTVQETPQVEHKVKELLEKLDNTIWGARRQAPLKLCQEALEILEEANLKEHPFYEEVMRRKKRFEEIEKASQQEVELYLKKARELFEQGKIIDAIVQANMAKLCYEDHKEAETVYKEYLEQFLCKDMVKIKLNDRWLMVDKYEVTNRQYALFVKLTGHPPPVIWGGMKQPPEKILNYPVSGVSYYDAVEFAKWAGKRLPTADEWEEIAGKDNLYPWSKDESNQIPANCVNNYKLGEIPRPMPVGGFEEGKTPSGIYDMAGNVWEWTSTSMQIKDTTYYLLKGGSFLTDASCLKVHESLPELPEMMHIDTGFRCVKDVE